MPESWIVFFRTLLSVIVSVFRFVFLRSRSLILTAEGWILVLSMVLIGLAALNTGAPLLYLMFSMLCSLFILSALLAVNSIRSIDIIRELPHVWVAGEPVRVVLKVLNLKKLWMSYSLRLRDLMDYETSPGGVYVDRLPPGKKEVHRDYQCIFPQRGLHTLTSIELATRFPFGLIERRLYYQQNSEILILPQIITIDHAMETAKSELGDYDANVKGRGISLYGLREYSSELPARDIHWKLSARKGNLIFREYESEERRRASVIMDNAVAADERENVKESFERAIILAASAVKWLIEHDHEVELRTASGTIGFGQGPAHVTRIRRALASLEFVEPGTGDHHLNNPEPDVVHFPISYLNRLPKSDGYMPLSIHDFEEELNSVRILPELKPRPFRSLFQRKVTDS